MRRHGKTDGNQTAIVQGLLDHGRSVQSLASVGGGAPDCVVGYRGRNWLIEIKNPEHPPSHRKLTRDQEVWHGTWRGQVAVVETLEQALRLTEEQ